MSFKGFSIFSFGCHCSAKWNHFSNFGRGPLEEHFHANILKSGHWPRTSCHLKIFYFLALAVTLFNGVELLRPSWISDQHNFSLFQSRSHPVATQQVSAQSNQRFGKRCQKLIFKITAVVASLDFLSAHLAILCLLGALMLTIKF